jgi:hypothetical protein
MFDLVENILRLQTGSKNKNTITGRHYHLIKLIIITLNLKTFDNANLVSVAGVCSNVQSKEATLFRKNWQNRYGRDQSFKNLDIIHKKDGRDTIDEAIFFLESYLIAKKVFDYIKLDLLSTKSP